MDEEHSRLRGRLLSMEGDHMLFSDKLKFVGHARLFSSNVADRSEPIV